MSFDGKVVDQQTTTFGIRSIEFSAEKGFLLNGENVLLKGGCMHHDNGPLGAATIDRAEERRVELMKAYGFNAIRTSHNPPSKQFLNACDRLGI
ncbi:MAG: glycoside hydrolase family 2, partial [Paludibacter sp.]